MGNYVRKLAPGGKSPTLRAAIAETKPGLCAFCDGPLPVGPGRKRVRCLARECHLEYLRAYGRDRYLAQRSA